MYVWLSVCLSICLPVPCGLVFFRPQWSGDGSLWPSGHLPALQLGRPNELDPDTARIRLMNVFSYKMTEINGREGAEPSCCGTEGCDGVWTGTGPRSPGSHTKCGRLRLQGKPLQVYRAHTHTRAHVCTSRRCNMTFLLHVQETHVGGSTPHHVAFNV